MNQAVKGEFWASYIDEKKGIIITIYPEKLNEFVSKQLGFYLYIDIQGKYQLVRVKQKSIVQEAQIEDLKQSIKFYIKEILKNNELWGEFFKQNIITENFIALLELLPDIKFNISTKFKANFFFKNGVLILEKDKSPSLIPYEQFDGHIWEKQIINRDFIYNIEYQSSEFNNFLQLITGDRERYFSLISIIGYLLHPFKDPSFTKAVILLDDKMVHTGEAFGGTGKGIIAEALKSFTSVVWKDGKTFNNRETFAFDDIRNHHRLLIFDDVNKDFDFEILYSMITGDLTAKRKYKDSVTMSFNSSPKILIISNYMVKGSGGDTDERRRIEFTLKPYFSLKYTPLQEFGQLLFKDWNDSEWNLFDNLMAMCVHYYMKHGVQQVNDTNLALNKLKAATHPDFIDFIDEYVTFDVPMDKKIMLECFKTNNPDQRFISYTVFKKWINSWCNHRGYSTHHYKSSGKSVVKISKNDIANN